MWLYYDLDFRFNQLKCREYGLNNDDLYVLSYLNQLYLSSKAKFKEFNGKKYILITAKKLEDDCILTYWKAKTFKNKLKHYQFLGLIEIHRENPRSNKMYFELHLDALYDNKDDEQWKHSPGQDTTLAWYSHAQKINRFRNEIMYRQQTYKYFSTGIVASLIHKYNNSKYRSYPQSVNSFNEVFKSALRRLISTDVYEKYFKSNVMIIHPGGQIQLNFYPYGTRDAILCMYRFELERAICDAFLYICRDSDAREKLSRSDINLY